MGSSRAIFMNRMVGQGKLISVRPRSMPFATRVAARSELMSRGIWKRFFAVISVATKPGWTVVTVSPRGLSSVRKLSIRAVTAALLAE